MKKIFIFALFLSPFLISMEQKEIEFDKHYEQYKASQEIIKIIKKHLETGEYYGKKISIAQEVRFLCSNKQTKQGIFLEVNDGCLEAIHDQLGHVEVPRWHHPLISNAHIRLEAKDLTNITCEPITKQFFDGGTELYPVLEVEGIGLPPAIKMENKKYDDREMLKMRELLYEMEQRYAKENAHVKS